MDKQTQVYTTRIKELKYCATIVCSVFLLPTKSWKVYKPPIPLSDKRPQLIISEEILLNVENVLGKVNKHQKPQINPPYDCVYRNRNVYPTPITCG